MKLSKKLTRNSPIEINESFISPELTQAQKEETILSFRQYRQKIELQRSAKDKLIVQLLQLKYLMEDYLSASSHNEAYSFGFFLKEYIERQNKKNKDFANEIDIDPSLLSQIIHSHRKPSEEFIIRLELHSNKNFPAIIWYKLLEKEKEQEIMNDLEIRNLQKKHVKRKLEFSF
ncbi:MAG: helix-turn-helix transcriptional regulator [Taibaiella sp.]|nr:helix-turn-helix transcriptional regulator [Taibaiella sp.]